MRTALPLVGAARSPVAPAVRKGGRIKVGPSLGVMPLVAAAEVTASNPLVLRYNGVARGDYELN